MHEFEGTRQGACFLYFNLAPLTSAAQPHETIQVGGGEASDYAGSGTGYE